MVFIIASVSFHAGLLIISNSTTITLPGSSESVMMVRLKQKTNEVDKAFVKRTETKTVRRKTYTETGTSFKTPKPNTKHYQQEKKQNTHSRENVTVSKVNSDISRARVVSILHEKLKQHFSYPVLAQRKNWQGKVLLTLRITHKGTIEDVQLNKSSGYSILDQAAITSLVNLGQLPKISSWLSSDLDLKIPVLYQLIEG